MNEKGLFLRLSVKRSFETSIWFMRPSTYCILNKISERNLGGVFVWHKLESS